MTKNWLKNIYKLLLKYALIEDCFRFFSLQLKVLNLVRDCRQHILAIITKDRASLHFVNHCDYLFETHAFLFQLVVLVIAPVIIGNLFDLTTCNFWILNCINAVFSDLLSPSDFEFIDHWLRRCKISSKLAYSAADISVVNSFTRASNSKSPSSLSFISSFPPLMPHFLKQLLIVKLLTSLHASCSHRMLQVLPHPWQFVLQIHPPGSLRAHT